VIGFDAGQLTLETGLLVIAAAKAAASGSSMEEIIAFLKGMGSRIHSFAALDTLEYLRLSGRVSGLQNRLGTLLQIKPI
jgi:fatty acid-binding protein DegV